MSNIPKAEQYVDNPNYGKKATTNKPVTKKAATQAKPQTKQKQEKKKHQKLALIQGLQNQRAQTKLLTKECRLTHNSSRKRKR